MLWPLTHHQDKKGWIWKNIDNIGSFKAIFWIKCFALILSALIQILKCKNYQRYCWLIYRWRYIADWQILDSMEIGNTFYWMTNMWTVILTVWRLEIHFLIELLPGRLPRSHREPQSDRWEHSVFFTSSFRHFRPIIGEKSVGCGVSLSLSQSRCSRHFRPTRNVADTCFCQKKETPSDIL